MATGTGTAKHIIYGLLDPIDNVLHYIGLTSDPKKRLNNHYNGNEGTKEKLIWIRHLKKNGLKPIMEVIEEYETSEELPEAERYWYCFYKFFGAELFNDPYYIGSGSRKGRKTSEETKAKQSAAKKEKKFSEEHKANLSIAGKAAQKGRVISEAHRAKLSAANKGKIVSEEARANMSIAAKKRNR